MAKVNGREDALLQAYLSRYKAAQDSAVTGGQKNTQKAQRQGSAILNATDKTLPSLGNPYESTLKNIVSGVSTENSLNLDFMNRQVKLAKAQYDAAQDYAKQMEKAQSYAAKAAAKATKRRTGKGNAAGQNTSTDLSDTAANALNGLNSSGTNTKANSTKPSNNAANRKKKPSAQEQYLADKASGKRKAITSNSYAERSNAAQPAQSRAVTKGGKVIGSSYAAAGSAPSASERTAAKQRQERVADILQKLQTDASYRAELAAPGRKLDSAEVEAVNQYVKNTKNTGFSGLNRVIDLAKNSDNLSKDEYAKKSAELNAELNQNSALRSKAQGNGAGQSAQAFTAGLYDSVPFLSKASDAMASAANATGLGSELPMLTKTLEDTKTYDPVAATLGTIAGKGMQYNLFNTLAAGTKYGKAAQAAGGKIGAAAQKIPGLGALVGDGFGDAAGRVLADTGADFVLDTLPSLASDVSEGKSAGEVAGNAAKNLVGNVAMNALPEIGGAVFNRFKGAAGDAAQDAAQVAKTQETPAFYLYTVPADDTLDYTKVIQDVSADAQRTAAQRTRAQELQELLAQQAEQDKAAYAAKQAAGNSADLPIDGATGAVYNKANGGVLDENLGGVLPGDVPLGINHLPGAESESGDILDFVSGQYGAAGAGNAAQNLAAGAGTDGTGTVQSLEEWAKGLTGKDRRSPVTRGVEDIQRRLQAGESYDTLKRDADSLALSIVGDGVFGESMESYETTLLLKEYFGKTEIHVGEAEKNEILRKTGLKNLQQFNYQNGTRLTTKPANENFDTALLQLADMGVRVDGAMENGNQLDPFLDAIEKTKPQPLAMSAEEAALNSAYTDYISEHILRGVSAGEASNQGFEAWLLRQNLTDESPDYMRTAKDWALDGVARNQQLDLDSLEDNFFLQNNAPYYDDKDLNDIFPENGVLDSDVSDIFAMEHLNAAKAVRGAEVPKESPYYDDWLRTQGALRQEQTLADLSGEAADMQKAANRLDALNAQNEALLRQNDIWQAEQNQRMARKQALDEIQARYEDAVNRVPVLDNLTDTSGWQTQQGAYFDGGVPYLTKDTAMPDAANRSALNTLDELRGQVNLNGAQEKEDEQLRRAVLQRQQEIGDEAKLALQNSGNMPIDSNAQKGYNAIINDGGAQNGTEINVGRSVEGTEPGGAGSGVADVQGAGRNANGNQGVFRQPVIDDVQRQAIENTGASWGIMQDMSNDPETFVKSLDDAIVNNKHGLMVSPKTVEDLQQPGTKVFMTQDRRAGAIVTADGDIEAVHKNPDSSARRASTQLMITAIENGGNKLDCYGADLVRNYNFYGFEPVAKVKWNPDYAPDGWTYGAKDVYVMKLQDGVDTNTVLQRFGKAEADGGFHIYNQAELDALPTMEYDEALAYRDSLLKTPSAMTEGVSAMPDAAKNAAQSLPLNGSESVPEHAVGAASTQYDRREVLNQDYANQRRFNADLEPDEVAALGADQNTHTLYTRKESSDTARLNYDTYLQQGDGSISEASKAVLQDLRGKTNWNADDIALAKHAAEQQRNYLYTLEKGSDEYNLEFARYKQLDSETSRGLSGAARTLYEGREAKPNGYTGIRKFEQYTQVLTDDFAKTRDGKGLKQVADVVYNGEINDFLTQLEKENRLDEAMLEAEKQIRNAAKAKNVKISDDAVKSAAASLVAGGNADDMFNALARTKLGIGDISQEDYDFVRGVFERVADMPDSKARRELEMSAYSRLAKYMPAKSFGDKVNNLRYLCMLGNTRTHGRNILGNILMNTVVRTKDNVAGVMQLALPQEQRTKAIGTMLTADGRKMADLAREYADNKMYSILYDNGKYNVQTGLEGARRIYKDGTIGNALESLAKVNSNALEKEDAYFLKAEFGNSMASFLKARGYDSSVFTATDDSSKQVLQQAAAQALDDAKEATFHEDNFLSTALSNLSKEMRYNGGVLGKLGYAIEEGILPFKKTPLNVAKNALEYNPVGGTVEAIYRAAKGQSAARVVDAAAKGVTGGAIMGIGYILARNGFLTGGATGDDRADRYREMLGEQDYAVKIPGKGTYTIDWASPASVPLLIGAEIAQDNSELTPWTVLDKFRHLSQPVLETTMLKGLNDTLDNISYADSDEKLFALLAGGAGDFAQQFVPTVLGQTARTIDPVRRSSYGGGQSKTERDTGYALRSTMNKIPGLSLQNEPYIDQWGREQASLDGTDDSAGGMFLRGAYNMLSPGYIRQENITPVDEYLQGLYGSTNDSGVLPDKASNSVTVDSKKYYLTPEEKTQYAKTRGQISYDAVDSLRQNSLFLQLPEDQQNEIVKDVYTVAGTAAAADTLGDGVSGTNTKAYKAYEQGGILMLENYLLADSAIKDAGATKQADVARELLNSGLDSEGIYNSYILKYPKDQKAPAVYSQYGADGAKNWLRYQAAADMNGNGRISQDEARAVLDAMNLTDAQRAYYYLLTNSGWSAKNNPYGGA